MFGIFRKPKKSKLRESFYPRNDRQNLEGEVYIKRSGHPALRGNKGNISDGGLYVELLNHNLGKGCKVEIILVSQFGSVKRMARMKGIVVRTDQIGAAFVTYKKTDLKPAK